MPRRSYSRNSAICVLLICRSAPVVVLEPDDIVFTEIRAVLHFDDVQGIPTRIFQPVLRLHRNSRALPDFEVKDLVSPCDAGCPGDDHPMFAALMVQLERKTSAGVDSHPLHLV